MFKRDKEKYRAGEGREEGEDEDKGAVIIHIHRGKVW